MLARHRERLIRQPPLVVAAPAHARDERQVGDRPRPDHPLLGGRRQYRCLPEPALRLVQVPRAVVGPAERPGNHRPPWRLGPLDRGGPRALLEHGPDVAPRERGGQHRHARAERGEAVRQRPVVEPAELAHARQRRAHVPLAPPQRRDPRAHEQQPPVAGEHLGGDPLQPVVDRRRAAGVDVVHPDLGDQLPRLGLRAGRDRVLDRLVGRAVLAVPRVRAGVQLRHELGLPPLQLDAQELREQVVEAEPLAPVVERQQEQVRACERLERGGGHRLAGDGVAQRRAEPLEHRRAQHEGLQLRVEAVEHLGREEVDDVRARAVEGADERRLVVLGSARVASTSWTVVGRCSTNHATLSRAVAPPNRWKSSSTSTTSSCSSSALTSRGSATSSSGAPAAAAASSSWASPGQARHSASTMCDHSTTVSSSPPSSVTHATGRCASSCSRQAASSVDLPNPAGQATRLRRRPLPSRSRANRRSRATVCAGTNGGCSFVRSRTGAA
jgi:hypothetical protein